MEENVTEFLKRLGMKDGKPGDDQAVKWQQVVKPETVSIILGRKGFGKSGLAYWLCDDNAKRHQLLPVVINLPRERQSLLPGNFVIRGLDDVPRLSDAAIIIDEGTTMLPAGQKKLEEMVKGYVALSRQRNQLILFIFHSSSDAGSRILRGVDAVLLKEPSQRQIQFGSKDNWFRELLTEAKGKFESLEEMGANPKEFTFIDSEEPEFRGMLRNPLPEFWSDGLSKAWASVDNVERPLGLDLYPAGPSGVAKGWRADDPEAKLTCWVSAEMARRAIVVEEHPFANSCYVIMYDEATGVRWIKQVY